MDKDQLMKRADELLKFILDGLEQGKEFAADQMPLLIQEVIRWGIVESLLNVTLATPVLVLSAYWTVKTFRYCVKERTEGPVFIFTGIPGAVAFCVIAHYLLAAAQAYFAPRVYLLTVLKGMLK